MRDTRCTCSMAISLVGDGCRYCQPQECIDRMGEWLNEERADNERLKGIIDEAEHCQWCATNDDAPGDCDCFKSKLEGKP